MSFYQLRPSETLRLGIVCFIGGFFLSQYLAFHFLVPFVAVLSLLFVTFRPQYKVFLFLGILFCGIFYSHLRESNVTNNDILTSKIGQTVTLNGVVDSFPDQRIFSSRAYIRITEYKQNDILIPIKARILLVTKPNITYDYGHTLQITGTLQDPGFVDDFDYRKYLERFGVQTLIRNPKKLTILSEQNSGSSILYAAKSTRNTLERQLHAVLPAPHSDIALGVLLGVKKELITFSKDAFHNAGLQHILVVSGFNITVLVLFISLLFRRFGRPVIFLIALLSILFYTFLTGGEPPVIRASIMGAIVGFAAVTGRFADARNLLLVSLLIIGLWNPLIILQDAGLVLSFGATLGIILLAPWFENIFKKIPNTFQIRTLLAVSCAAQIAVTPLVAFFFGQIQPIGLLSNIFIEPLIPLTMLFAVVALGGTIFPFSVAHIIALPAFLVLEVLLWVVHTFGQFKPMQISDSMSQILFCILFVFFLYGLFSRWYQTNVLETGFDPFHPDLPVDTQKE